MTPEENTPAYDIAAGQAGRPNVGPAIPWTAGGLMEPGAKNIFTGIENFSQPVKINGEKIRMLLIDDNLQDAMKLRQIIREITCWQINFDWAETMKEAMVNGRRHAYDFCMMDLTMARKNSTDVIDLVGVISKNGAAVPFILLKNNADKNTDIALADSESANESANESIDCLEKASLTPELLKHCIRYTIERSQRVRKLKEAQKCLQDLSSKLINAQECERKIIGREIHDSIGSGLTAIRIALESKKNSANGTGEGAEGIPIEDILSMIDETIDETRRISEKLRPPLLDDLGLVKTIGWMCRKFNLLYPRINIKTDVRVREPDVPDPLKIVIYRILQEAFHNIAKHSQADTVHLGLRRLNNDLELIVHDNGSGFDPENMPSPEQTPGGYGLEGMQDRVKFTQGSFEIISEKGKGTTLRILWPMPAEPDF